MAAKQKRPRGWWRRNIFGLVALLPVMVLAVTHHIPRMYELYWTREPREPIQAAAGDWVTFEGARMRLSSLKPAEDLKDWSDEPLPLPAGVTAWQATVAFDVPPGVKVGGCDIWLEDRQERLFAAGPAELYGARVRSSVGCGAPNSYDDKPEPTSYEGVYYFVMPNSSQPAAVRISYATSMPKYARLT